MGFEPHRKKCMSFPKSSLAAHRAISSIYLMVSKIYLYRFMRLNIDQITVYQSLFINKANVNRGSRNGMTCIYVAKTKALISFAVTAKLICVFFCICKKPVFSRCGSYCIGSSLDKAKVIFGWLCPICEQCKVYAFYILVYANGQIFLNSYM